jgi:hypothetical protein
MRLGFGRRPMPNGEDSNGGVFGVSGVFGVFGVFTVSGVSGMFRLSGVVSSQFGIETTCTGR